MVYKCWDERSRSWLFAASFTNYVVVIIIDYQKKIIQYLFESLDAHKNWSIACIAAIEAIQNKIACTTHLVWKQARSVKMILFTLPFILLLKRIYKFIQNVPF